MERWSEGKREREGTDEGQSCELKHEGDFYPLFSSAFAINSDYLYLSICLPPNPIINDWEL